MTDEQLTITQLATVVSAFHAIGDKMELEIFVNTRVLQLQANGQKRVTQELINRLPNLQHLCPPQRDASGLRGHAWEQLRLPIISRGKPLWSPSTSGPLFYQNQVVTVHDIAFLDVPQFFSRQFALWYGAMIGRLVRSACHVVTVSDFTKQRLLETFRLPEAKITRVYLGVTSQFYPRSSVDVTAVLSKYELGNSDFVMGFSGTDPRKNTAGLLEGWRKSSAAAHGSKLVLFGRASNSAVFSSEHREGDADGVTYVGAVADDELASLFTASKGFVFPSYYEGFGLPIIEAASCGCPIATSNLTSLPEVSPADTIYFDPSVHNEIAKAMQDLLSHVDTLEVRIQRSNNMAKFDWDEAAAAYTQIFSQVF